MCIYIYIYIYSGKSWGGESGVKVHGEAGVRLSRIFFLFFFCFFWFSQWFCLGSVAGLYCMLLKKNSLCAGRCGCAPVDLRVLCKSCAKVLCGVLCVDWPVSCATGQKSCAGSCAHILCAGRKMAFWDCLCAGSRAQDFLRDCSCARLVRVLGFAGGGLVRPCA